MKLLLINMGIKYKFLLTMRAYSKRFANGYNNIGRMADEMSNKLDEIEKRICKQRRC